MGAGLRARLCVALLVVALGWAVPSATPLEQQEQEGDQERDQEGDQDWEMEDVTEEPQRPSREGETTSASSPRSGAPAALFLRSSWSAFGAAAGRWMESVGLDGSAPSSSSSSSLSPSGEPPPPPLGRHERWDPEEAYFALEAPADFDYGGEEARRLHVMTSRAKEVTRHRDIVTAANGGSSRVFEDSGVCGVGDDDAPCCNQTCSGLSYCSALNGRRIEDKYFPTLPFIQGTCENLDERAQRLEVWGDFHTSKPFRDTEECRQLVLDYTCLHWATMFQDRCFNTTDAPRKPCRSFCVDLGLACANDPFDWVNLCHNIECPTKAGKCSRSAENITRWREGTFHEESKDCWITKVPSAYSAAPRSVRTHARGGAGTLATAAAVGAALALWR